MLHKTSVVRDVIVLIEPQCNEPVADDITNLTCTYLARNYASFQ